VVGNFTKEEALHMIEESNKILNHNKIYEKKDVFPLRYEIKIYCVV
jgi:hypothetical protein